MSEADFIERIRRGDGAAFERLFREYYDALVAFAAGLLRAPDGADDIVCDVFTALWERRTTWEPRSVRGYLYSAVRHRVYNALRDAKRTIPWDASAEGEATDMTTVPPLADAAVVRDEDIQVLRDALDALPPARRMAMLLRWRDGLSFDEIAEAMGISSNAVQLHLSRSLAWLRRVLPSRIGP
jgi:RNA polymerase sigma-70 factor (ECF subfamily)